jgi:hypothetical protein
MTRPKWLVLEPVLLPDSHGPVSAAIRTALCNVLAMWNASPLSEHLPSTAPWQ